jgi:hypothetical protein
VAGHRETFLARQNERDRPLPGFVEREFRDFLDCILARAFFGCIAVCAVWIGLCRTPVSIVDFAILVAGGAWRTRRPT